MEKVGRNDLCSCGSGKKYKKCCGKNQDVVFINEIITQEAIQLQQELFHYALTQYEEELGDFIAQRIHHLPIDDEWEETFMLYVTQWAIFCEPLVNGKTIVEHYIQTRASQIKRSSVRSLLRSWSDEVPSFARIIEKETLDLIVVEDIFTHERKRITLSFTDIQLEIGSLIIALLVPVGSTYTFFHSCLEIDREKADVIVEALQTKFKEADEPVREFVVSSFPELLYECFEQPFSERFEVEDLLWDHPVHEQTAYLLKEKMDHMHGEGPLTNIALILWRAYCGLENPSIKKPELYAAAIHYLTVVTVIPYKVTTQKEIAEYYGVSSSSMSAKYREMEEVLAEFIEQMYEKMDSFDLDDEDELDDVSISFSPFQHSRMATERELRKIDRIIQEKEFSSIEEANEYIQSVLNSRDDSAVPLSPKEEAQELLYQAFEERSRKKRLELAHQALKLYPNNPDAYNILGDEAATLEEAADYYKKGMEAGEKDLGKRFFRENKGHFWGIVETRPYMRAKANYAQALWQLGEKEKAVEQYEQLLQLNPNDNQGIRYFLFPAYIELKKYDEAEELIDQYDEPTALIVYNRLLVSYLKYGLHEELEELLDEAVNANPYVIDYLLKKKRLPKQAPPFFGFGDENEAIAYAKEHLHLWQQERELLDWLRTMARSLYKK